MRFRHANIMILLAAIGAFLPLVMVPTVLDRYVRTHEAEVLQARLDGVAERIRNNVQGGLVALERLLADAPASCGPDFLEAAQREMAQSVVIRDVSVIDPDGAVSCDALGGTAAVEPLSDATSLPGRSETLTLVRLGTLPVPFLRLSAAIDGGQRLAVLVPVLTVPASTLLGDDQAGLALKIKLAGGIPVVSAGPRASDDDDTARIAARALVSDLPVEVAGALPLAAARSHYADFGVVLTIAAGLLSGALLLLILALAKRMALPSFDIERAIARNEIVPYYQPVIDVSTGRLAGCEVLARWVEPDGSAAQPGPFIDYAEASGLAVPMTLSIMRQVAADLGELCRAMPEMRLSFNLFEGHFRDTAILEDVAAVFGNSGLRFDQLVFEITERRPLPEIPSAQAVISGLHALGARLAMDDVGTGHSNLAYMQTLGVDVIKIDRVFVQMVGPETRQVAVLDGLIGMARKLGTEIVAEGIETAAQARYLKARGVRLVQGYFFAPALGRASFVELAEMLNGRQAIVTTSSARVAEAA